MNAAPRAPERGDACSSCLRRSWLLAQLSGRWTSSSATVERLTDLLALSDEHLLSALGGTKERGAEYRLSRALRHRTWRV